MLLPIDVQMVLFLAFLGINPVSYFQLLISAFLTIIYIIT